MPGNPDSAAHPQGWAVHSRHAIMGVGVGLRMPHVDHVLRQRPAVPWFEILADNHVSRDGLIQRQMDTLREHYPITLHCVGMSLGGTDPLDESYLQRIEHMIRRYQPAWISDHLCFSQLAGRQYHDLLPLPYTEEALKHVSARVDQVQNRLQQSILVENVSAYVRFNDSTLSESEFLVALAAQTGCGLLLDVNNLYVNQFNHGDDAAHIIDSIDPSTVGEVHLAGFQRQQEYLLDAHNSKVAPPVWALYERLLQRMPAVPTLIEWDNEIPAFSVLQEEAAQAAARQRGAQRKQQHATA